jgi:hypothetical protein
MTNSETRIPESMPNDECPNDETDTSMNGRFRFVIRHLSIRH